VPFALTEGTGEMNCLPEAGVKAEVKKPKKQK
jgi:hypothetical protein